MNKQRELGRAKGSGRGAERLILQRRASRRTSYAVRMESIVRRSVKLVALLAVGLPLFWLAMPGLANPALDVPVSSSFDFFLSRDVAIALLSNRTGDPVDGLILRFSDSTRLFNMLGFGADLTLVSDTDGEMVFAGDVVPDGTWQVNWRWDGPRLEYAAWTRGGVIVAEIPVHNPTAAFGMIGRWAGQLISFFAPAAGDPDGGPVRCLWVFDDGQTAEGVTVERTFEAGEHSVLLTVEDEDGNRSGRLGRFTIEACTLTVNVVGGGSVSQQPHAVAYEYGAVVTLTATESPHWHFRGWGGDHSGTDARAAVRVTGDMTVTGFFDQNPYTVSASTVGDGSLLLDYSGALSHTSASGSGNLTLTAFFGDRLTLTAIPGEQAEFAGWETDPRTIMSLVYPPDPVLSFEIEGNTSVIATFSERLLGGPVVYRANHGGAWNLYLNELDGTAPLKITSNADAGVEYQFPKWNPAGDKIAYVLYRPAMGSSDVCIYDAVTGAHETIGGYSVGGGRIAWLDDETLLIARRDYESGAGLGDSSYLHSLAIDGSSYETFYYAPGIEIHSPDVSEDGSRVVAKVQPTTRGYSSEILIMDNQGQNAVRLTDTSTGSSSEVGNNRGCAFLDDSHILFTRGIGGGRRDLLIMDIDGGNVTSIGALFANSLAVGYVPAVASDHETIIFDASTQTGGPSDLYVTDRAGSLPVNITNTPGVIENHPDVR